MSTCMHSLVPCNNNCTITHHTRKSLVLPRLQWNLLYQHSAIYDTFIVGKLQISKHQVQILCFYRPSAGGGGGESNYIYLELGCKTHFLSLLVRLKTIINTKHLTALVTNYLLSLCMEFHVNLQLYETHAALSNFLSGKMLAIWCGNKGNSEIET